MASIRTRNVRGEDGQPTPVWQVLYRHGKKQTSKTFTTQQATNDYVALIDEVGPVDAKEILGQPAPTDAHSPTLTKWALEVIDDLTGVSDSTRSRYRMIANKRLGRLGHLPVTTITGKEIARWINKLERDGAAGKTITNYHGLVSMAMKRAVHTGLIPANPCEGTRLPRKDSDDAEAVFLTSIEFALLLGHVRKDAQPLVTFMPATGLRFGEITALQVRDIDVDAKTVRVSRAWKDLGDGRRKLDTPKTRRSRRTVPIPDKLMPLVKAAIEGKKSTDFVFTNTRGTAWTRSRFHEGVWQPAVRAAMAPACETPLTKKPRVHDMRHTFASWLIQAGKSLVVVQRLLGHESIKTTIDLYSHLEQAQLVDASEAIGHALTDALDANCPLDRKDPQ